MIEQGGGAGNGARRPRFRPTPWTKDSEEWQRIDAELEEDHLARVIDECVECWLDLSGFLNEYGRRGSPAYPPKLLLKAVLFELARGHTSPAKWYEDAKENKAMQWLLMGATPSRRRWYAFRDRIEPYLEEWNAQVLARCREVGLSDATEGSLDGTFVAANSSRHRMLNQERLRTRREQLEEAVRADEEGRPVERPGQWMAGTQRGRAEQLERYRRAERKMEQLQAKNRRRRSDKRKDPEKILINPSDPDAVFGRDKEKVYRPLYNVQLLNDLKSPLILAYGVYAQANDSGLLAPMVERFTMLNGHKLRSCVADGAYAEPEDLAFCDREGIELFAPWQGDSDREAKSEAKWRDGSVGPIPKEAFRWDAELRVYYCPEGHVLRFEKKVTRRRTSGKPVRLEIYRCDPEHCRVCPRRAECTKVPESGRTVRRHEYQELIDAHRAKMATPEAKAKLRRRGCTAERKFADAKEHRGLRRFSGRGLMRVRTEVGLLVLVHNLRTLHTFLQQSQQEPEPYETLKIPP